MSVRGRGTACANVLWSQKALWLEEVSSGPETKLERWVKRILRRFRGHGTKVGFFSRQWDKQQRVFELGSDMVGLPTTEKADCEGRVWGDGFLEKLRGIDSDGWWTGGSVCGASFCPGCSLKEAGVNRGLQELRWAPGLLLWPLHGRKSEWLRPRAKQHLGVLACESLAIPRQPGKPDV